MLNGKVGLIYGDSITLARARDILSRLEAKGFAAGNIVLGVGSNTDQFLTRDSFGFAMKAKWGQVNGEARSIFKDPITDDGQRSLPKGLLRIERDVNNNLAMLDEQTPLQEAGGELQTVVSLLLRSRRSIWRPLPSSKTNYTYYWSSDRTFRPWANSRSPVVSLTSPPTSTSPPRRTASCWKDRGRVALPRAGGNDRQRHKRPPWMVGNDVALRVN
jgi:hypothetical protein